MLSIAWKLVVSRVRTMGSGGRERQRDISCPPHRKWEKNSKWSSPFLSLILESWASTCGQR
jgi:hypothetical protein